MNKTAKFGAREMGMQPLSWKGFAPWYRANPLKLRNTLASRFLTLTELYFTVFWHLAYSVLFPCSNQPAVNPGIPVYYLFCPRKDPSIDIPQWEPAFFSFFLKRMLCQCNNLIPTWKDQTGPGILWQSPVLPSLVYGPYHKLLHLEIGTERPGFGRHFSREAKG